MMENRESLAARIRALRSALRMNQAEFALRVGVEQPTVSRWESAAVYPEVESIVRMAKLANVSRLEFEYGEDAATAPINGRDNKNNGGIKISGDVAAGVWVEQAVVDQPAEYLTGFVPDHRYDGMRQFALVVRGSSVDRLRIFDGDIVVCVDWADLGKDFSTGDIVVVERARYGGQMIETTLKQIEIRNGNVELWPRSTDPRFQEPVVLSEPGEEEETTVRVTGLVVARTTVFP